MKKHLWLFLSLGFLLITCKKSDDLVVNQVQEESTEEPKEGVNTTVQDFMWQALNLWYFYQGDVPDLADDRFSLQSEYDEYLSQNPDPEEFLNNKLLFSEDRFTFYSDNYKDLTNFLAGIFKSNGMEFFLTRPPEGGNKVIGVVRYIIKDSDAASKDLQRGDIFYAVNGVELIAETDAEGFIISSNLELLDPDSYTLNMAYIVDNVTVPNDKEITLTKQEGLEEDPILLYNVLEISDKKIGYLMYNIFTAGSGERLNEVFVDFKAAGVTDLVLDLRYNGGGRGSTATILASLIYGPNTDDLFFKTRYNDKLQAIFDPSEYNFVNTTGSLDGNMNTPLSSLNLNKLYVLATSRSASASELVMVGLEPYLDIVHIGTTTVGKNQGSVTLVDDYDSGFQYSPDREDNINPGNQWGLQPLVSKVENAVGFSDYSDGLFPDIELKEDVLNLGILGDRNEPLLAMAIQEITGISAKRSFDVQLPAEVIMDSKMFYPFENSLILDNLPTSFFKNINSKLKK